MPGREDSTDLAVAFVERLVRNSKRMLNRLPLEEGYFTMPASGEDRPHLVGSYSPAADLYCHVNIKAVTGGTLSTNDASIEYQ